MEAEIKSEIHYITKIHAACQGFKIDFENNDKDKMAMENINNNNILMRDYIDVNANNVRDNSSNNNINKQNPKNSVSNQPNNEKKWERFGGRPPFSHSNNDDPFENNNLNNNEIYHKKNSNKKVEENFVVNKKQNYVEEKKEKDPMVWDPPEDKFGVGRNPIKQVKRSSNAQNPKQGAVNKPSNVNNNLMQKYIFNVLKLSLSIIDKSLITLSKKIDMQEIMEMLQIQMIKIRKKMIKREEKMQIPIQITSLHF